MLEIGRLCMKTAGREAGKYCVIVKKMDEKFVMVTGPKELTSVKRRRCNINHLEPMLEVLDIKSDAPDSDVLKAYQSAKLMERIALAKAGKVKSPARDNAEAEEPPKPPKKAEEKKDKPKAAKKAAKPKTKPKPAKKPAAKKAVKKPESKVNRATVKKVAKPAKNAAKKK